MALLKLVPVVARLVLPVGLTLILLGAAYLYADASLP
jgi:hypothetical protein